MSGAHSQLPLGGDETIRPQPLSGTAPRSPEMPLRARIWERADGTREDIEDEGPEAVGAAGLQVPRQTNLAPCHHTRRTNSPQKGLGVNQVDLGGMSSPASATAMSSSMAVGHTVNATASPASRAAASSASGPTVPAT